MSNRWPNDKGEPKMFSAKQFWIQLTKLLAWTYIAIFLIFAVAFLIGKAGAQENPKPQVLVYDDAKNPNNGAVKKVALIDEKPADKPKPPALSDSEKTKLREFQLKDSQITVEIQKRQLELYQLRDMQQSNTAALDTFKGGLCKAEAEDKNSYAVDTQNAQCIQVGQPKK